MGFYMTFTDSNGVVTFATEMGTCDYRGVFKGVGDISGAHLTSCYGEKEAKEEVRRIARTFKKDKEPFELRAEIDDEHYKSLSHKNGIKTLYKLIDEVFECLN